ncbi:MAG TPA: SPOR domain-containing protein, partial [Gemmatimonadales bacterium]|nr:SPOR domain-containing protein [Gemmatimonadales bacterium]
TPRARPVAAAPAPPRVDSLSWTVQLAAYAGLDKALALADRLNARGVTPFVTPIALGGRGAGGATVWYRVFAGAYPTRDSALSARAGLWARQLADRGQGDVLRAPYSLALARDKTGGGRAGRGGGGASTDSLRARGIPAVAWEGGRLLVGAFESPEQAAILESQLKRAGVSATLVTRMTTTP